MSGTTTLPCWVIGSPIERAFSVKIGLHNMWGSVKEKIKKVRRPEFNDIAADALDLWKVTIHHSQRSLLESEGFLKNVITTNPLDTLASLSTDLDPLADNYMIIVRRPATIRPSLTFFANTNKRRRPDSPFDTDGYRQKRQKESPRLSDQVLRSMKELYENINTLSEEPAKYSDPNEVFDLPFPSYLGRECFSKVWKAVDGIMDIPHHRQAIYIYGGKGFGKSHVLAALACFLVRIGTQVVYLPDCREWLFDPLTYLKNAIVFAFVNSELSLREEVLDCEDLESLANFCARYREMGRLCFVVDQLNALDPELMGQDVIKNAEKDSLRMLLHRISTGHILISSASANHKTFQRMEQRDTGEVKVPLMGGMTSSEMASWWKHHDFTAFSDADKQRVEDLTGCIPLLLKPFVMHHKETLESLEPQIWAHEVLESVREQTIAFAEAKKDQLKRTTFRDEFVDSMRKCLLGVNIVGVGAYIDHRYFYTASEGNGRYSCGLARQAITEFLRMNADASIFLGPEWYDTLVAVKDNLSVTRFIVKQMVISKIASSGLRLKKIRMPAAQIVTFKTLTARLLSIDRPQAYYVPVRFNPKSIDLLFASIDVKTKTAHIVPIQIAIARELKDSEAAFFATKDTWLRGLENYKVKISFLWIHHGDSERGRCEVEQKLELRSRTYDINLDYEVLWVSIKQIDAELARTLGKIRNGV